MSEQQRTIQFSEIASLLPQGGEFLEESRYGRDADAEFVPWGRSSFKPAPLKKPDEPEQPAVSDTKAPSDETPHDAPPADSAPTGAQAEANAADLNKPAQTTPPAQRAVPPPKPPPPPEPPGPTAQEIIDAIERSREDGRALGYQQGVEATKREIGSTLSTLRKLEEQITTLAQDALERNADIMAQHVRRIAQDLFGAVFAEMPAVFLERIKTAAEMFTKAGAEFTLAMNPRDALSLAELMKENEIFEKIRIVEDDKLKSGAFHLSSRDLDYEDAPLLSDIRGS